MKINYLLSGCEQCSYGTFRLMNEDATRIQVASERAVIEASLIRHLLPAFIMKAIFAAHFFSA